jgi:hypothetical protein
MRRTPLAVTVCTVVLSLAPGSYAQEVSTGASPDGPRWYGWQTRTVDGIALGTMLSYFPTAGDTGSTAASALFGVGLTGYAIGPPLVHLAHGRWAIGLADLGIRVSAPIVAGLIGSFIDLASNPNECQDASGPCGPFVGFGVGALVGYASAVAFDAVFLSRELGPTTLPPSAPPASTLPPQDTFVRTPARGFTLSPTLAAGPHGLNLGVVGGF